MKYKNCKECLTYDDFLDGQFAPCDEEGAMEKHYCVSCQKGIPEDIWRGKRKCPDLLEDIE